MAQHAPAPTGVERPAPARHWFGGAIWASLLRQHDIRVLYTNDVDFRRFDFLETRNPLA